jgi:hypothetical protein
VAYRYPEFDSLIRRSGWLQKTAETEQWAVYANRRKGQSINHKGHEGTQRFMF